MRPELSGGRSLTSVPVVPHTPPYTVRPFARRLAAGCWWLYPQPRLLLRPDCTPPGESTWVLHDYVQTPIRLTLKTCLPSGSPLPPVSQPGPGPGPGTILSPPRLRGLPTQRLASPLASVTGARGSRELAHEEDKHAGPTERTEHASVLLEARRRADGPLGSPAERAASVPRLEPNSEGVRSRSPCVPLLIRLLLMPEMDW